MLKILPFSTAAEFALKTKSALRLEAKSLSALLGWIQAASWEIGPLTLQLLRALVELLQLNVDTVRWTFSLFVRPCQILRVLRIILIVSCMVYQDPSLVNM